MHVGIRMWRRCVPLLVAGWLVAADALLCRAGLPRDALRALAPSLRRQMCARAEEGGAGGKHSSTSQFPVAVHRPNVPGHLLLRISDRRGEHRRCGGWGEFAEGQVRYEKEAAMLKSPRSSDFI